jgi:hypothetical protein
MTKVALAISLGLYVASFFLPAFDVLGGSTGSGISAFLIVATAPFDRRIYSDPSGPYFLMVWLSNPVFWAGLVCLIKEKGAMTVSAGTLAFACGLLMAFDPDRQSFDFHWLRAGYYCWLASMLTLALAGMYLFLAEISADVHRR